MPLSLAIAGPERLTYQALAHRADRLACALWQAGLRPGDRVALVSDRSADAVAAMLAVRQIDAAFVPIDPALPAASRQAILDDAKPRIMLADRDVAWAGRTLRPDQGLPDAPDFTRPDAQDESVAYVMYTSGSTGTPKGVLVPCRGVIRLVVDPDYVTLGPSDVLLHAAPLGFDASTFEIWGALLNGAALAIVPDPVPSLDVLAGAIAAHGVTTAWLTSGMFHAMVDQRLGALRPLRQLLAGGDVLSSPHVAKAVAGLPDTVLINGYGPTENTTFTCCYPIPRDHAADRPVPIGRPIRGTRVLILDPAGQAVPPGEAGELCAAGGGVALGYLNRPDLTARAFRPGPDGRMLYHSGDRARMRPDGVVEFLGRLDREVKIRGRRVALDEVEAELRREPGVQEAAVLVQDGRAQAYVTGAVDGLTLRRALLARLPDHMAPATITVMASLPLTRNGKLDRAALKASPSAPAPGDATPARLAAIWRDVLGRADFPLDANLFDAGASSMDVVRAHGAMADAGFPVSVTDLFAFPSITALAAHLDGPPDAAPGAVSQQGDAVAIIGMAARLPGAEDVPAFWRNLCDGVESIRRFQADALRDAQSAEIRNDPAYVAARPVLDHIDAFEPAFFGMTRREAELTDPQHRVFLELAWEAFEAAGYDPARIQGRAGVFAGSSPNSYLLRNVLADRAAVLRFTSDYQTGSYPTLLGAGADFLATRVAYKLDLRGPALTVSTACSTALVAVAQACAALRSGAADMALAGGVSITLPQQRGYLHQPGGLASADGHVRPFDASASGTVFGSGAGVVLLKRLRDAVADGDHIHAVIRGVATNNDGAGKVGFTAPSVTGQADCIRQAHREAGFDPSCIGFVEAHGTATPLGDPIEFAGLQQAFGAAPDGGCVIGSVKGNVGHLDAAAGAAGLIKAALAVESAVIPGTLHFTSPNPAITLAGSPFTLSGQTRPWRGATPRRAGVSAFGVGGTNAHAVLEQAPEPGGTVPGRAHQVLVLSARSATALAEARARLAAALTRQPGLNLADTAWTLQTGRRRFSHRAAVSCTSVPDAIAALQDGRAAIGEGPAGHAAFLFPGQGAQYRGMGHGLYRAEPAFRSAMDECADLLQPLMGLDLRDALYGAQNNDTPMPTDLAQPALFATGYATARLWQSWGIRPAMMLGHSVGEFVAACVAGVFTLADALRLIAERGRLMASMPPGGMLAVRLPEHELRALLGGGLDLAAVNAPSACVAAGPEPEITRLEAALTGRGVMHRRLATSHAFHSRMMDGVMAPLEAACGGVRLTPPAIPFVSCVTGALITGAQATSPAYWAEHCRAPVAFAAGLQTLLQSQPAALLECGPGRTLSGLAKQGAARGIPVAHSLPDAEPGEADEAAMARALAQLAAAGVEADWAALHGPGRRRVPLPATPWDRIRCWIDEPDTASLPEVAAPMEPIVPPAADTTATELAALFEELSGDPFSGHLGNGNFLSMGFDSLFLGQVAQQVRARFDVTITFRQLMGEYDNFAALAEYVGANRPKQQAPAIPPAPPAHTAESTGPAEATSLMQQQIAAMSALFAQQLAALNTGVPMTAKDAPKPAPVENTARFDAFKPTAGTNGAMTPAQRAHVDSLIAATVARTPRSKQMTAQARRYLADPRAAAGFRPDWKEMVYPVVAVRSAGPLIWDADGNDYVDLVNGFGQTLFGHAPPFVTEAVRQQLDRGFEIGPQAELAGRVAEQFCSMTGNERMTFCNTGSEAVMAAMRIARTVTGRDRIAVFAGSYHGQFDEVLVKATPKGARPVAPGIPLQSAANMTVLEYGTEAALAWIKEHAQSLAAVIVEPVQSRHPALQPQAFLQQVRALTEQSGTCLVFDEVVTGFRAHPGGMQAVFGIRADLATYGKVVGGGLPVGILAGKAAFMDALDGGDWRYGDDSTPDAAVTFFAGTFVRHPLALAAINAVLDHLTAQGPALYHDMAGKTAGLAGGMNAALSARGLPACVQTYASWLYFKLPDPLATLLYPNMRLRGVHIQEGFPCFLTTEHGAAEIARILDAFTASLDALQAAGILGSGDPVSAPAQITEAPLTEAQMEVWLATQMGDAASCAFNEGISLHMRGRLDIPALTASVARLFSRHDALRARFTATGTRMLIAPDAPAALRLETTPLDAVLDEEARTPFDLMRGPPARMRLVRVAGDHHVLVLTAHHIICDGWSINALLAELADTGSPTPAQSFAAYAAARQSLRAEADLAWWKDQFAAIPAPLELPGDRVRPALRSYAGGTRQLTLDAGLLSRVRDVGARNGCTLFSTLLAAVGILVGRLGGQQDVVIAVPAAAQSQMDGAVLVGHCANLLPLRAAWTDGTPVSDHLRKIRDAVLDAYEHQDCTLGTIIRALDLPRDTSRLPLTCVQFNLERLADGMAMPGVALSCQATPKAFVNFDLFFNAVESAAGLVVDCDYNADLFDPQTVDRWLGHLRTILEALAAEPGQRAGDLPLLSAAERHTIRQGGTGVSQALPPGPVDRLIGQQAKATPDAIAARFGDLALTYGALDERANQMAHYLALHAAPGSRIAVMLDRTPDMLVSLLGIWKAGMAYVPLDPSHPAARLAHIVSDAGISGIITDGSGPALEAPLFDLRSLRPAIEQQSRTAPALPPQPDPLAYVIYTSGSTGQPKGVAIGHAALANLLLSMGQEPGIEPGDIWLAVTTIGFDIAGLEIWGPLIAGAQVVVASRADAMDGNRLRSLLESSRATVMQATPGTWRLLLESGWQPGALKMLCGGEALPRALADRLLTGGGPLWNVYGPTETTIWSALDRVGDGPVTIGHAIANTRLLVLDAADRLLPVGVPGQLHIGGAGLAQGYLGRPDLTAEKFVTDPSQPGERLYRTGDLALLLPDGRIQVLGRMDGQMKLRGYRLEAGEVEHALTTACGATDAAVALRDGPGGEQRLIAWIVMGDGAVPGTAAFRASLRTVLPEYMIPSHFVPVKALPLTPNGKVDRAALPDAAPQEAPAVEPPETALERSLAKIWAEILGQDIGRNTDLLAAGADSIQLFQITARTNAAGMPVLARDLLHHRTVAALAAVLGSAAAAPQADPAIPSLKQFRRDHRVLVGE